MLGRTGETRRIERLLEAARIGESGALLVLGEPGIGKTALLNRAQTNAPGMVVLAAAGVESESELSFAALGDLLRPVLDRLHAIPAPQATALESALSLGPPVPERFAAYAATLSLLAAVAEEAPILVVVDDVHWLDSSSREAILFAARRLQAERVALLLAARAADWEATPGIPVLTLGGLDQAAAEELVARSAKTAVAEDVARRLVIATDANPLALVEASGLLTPGQLAGSEPISEPIPVGPSLERAFLRRAEALPAEARLALLVASASENSSIILVVQALGHLGLGPASLEPAESARLVTIRDGNLHFQHPLLRSAVYHAAIPAERRKAHAALAASLGDDESGQRRAWHLAAAALGPDESVAASLEASALDASARGGHSTAARALERAAQLTSSPGRRAERLLAAAHGFHLGGRDDRALALLDQAIAADADPLRRADAELLRAHVALFRGSARGPCARLIAEAELVEAADPNRAAVMLATAVVMLTTEGNVAPIAAAAERARITAEQAGHEARSAASAAQANALILCGRAVEAREHVEAGRALMQEADPLAGAWLVHSAAHTSVWIEDYVQARALLDRVIAAAREASAIGLLPFPLAVSSELGFRIGAWTSAYAEATESIQLAEVTGQLSEVAFSLLCGARIEAAQGREQLCRDNVARARKLATSMEVGCMFAYAGSVLGLLELGLGRFEQAAAELEDLAVLIERQEVHDPSVVQWAPDLIEAYVRSGRRADAERILASFQAEAHATNRSWALASALRCRGMLAREAEYEHLFEQAFEQHERKDTPFEHGRTALCFGERLRRSRRRSRARAELGSALEVFEQLGAAPWSGRARAELRAAGGRLPDQNRVQFVELTWQELQVALTVGSGATNKEAAASLFLSPKTIEFHLGNVYRKLGLRSRTELARIVATHDGAVEASADGSEPDRGRVPRPRQVLVEPK